MTINIGDMPVNFTLNEDVNFTVNGGVVTFRLTVTNVVQPDLRLLEDGEYRLLEDGDFRLMEN